MLKIFTVAFKIFKIKVLNFYKNHNFYIDQFIFISRIYGNKKKKTEKSQISNVLNKAPD